MKLSKMTAVKMINKNENEFSKNDGRIVNGNSVAEYANEADMINRMAEIFIHNTSLMF